MENEPWYKKCIRCKNRMFGICMADVTIKQFAENGSICPLWEGKTMEIKPCPFCGSEKVSLGSCLEKLYQVECMNCGANGSCVASAKKAVWLWNFALRKESKSTPLNAENPSGKPFIDLARDELDVIQTPETKVNEYLMAAEEDK